MELFERSWRTYRAVVDHDLMEHRSLTSTLGAVLGALVRPGAAAADLGCGDLALLAPLLRSLPLGRFEAVDAAAAVLPLAAQNLAAAAPGPVPYPCRWTHQDLLTWAQQPDAGGGFDLISCSYALHHLLDDDKQRVLAALAQRLNTNGVLLIADVFRQGGESLPSYLERYTERVQTGWQVLSADQRLQVVEHLTSSDLPAEGDDFVERARREGWTHRWIWRGSHQAEALLLLWPAGHGDPGAALQELDG
ncbi:class I SAM-dependent methyltransferase [Cyanobium sp. Morenito 9A2]|nr:class I SAM-dependent methyltransferase [Cyanobium sp. Morenito 9A2]